ncbi:MAG TPA: hypothetical protein VGK93_12730 [Candidatus Eisenbacteria bacterium]|jgi:hypothetical protein
MMLSVESTMRVVFTIFFGFWAVVIVGLFLGTGLLLKKYERKGKASGGGH